MMAQIFEQQRNVIVERFFENGQHTPGLEINIGIEMNRTSREDAK
jgi:hypothetical protein